MTRFFISFMFFILGSLAAGAQQLAVESFTSVPTDLTARKQPRQDLNGRTCAMVKVYVGDEIVGCDGGMGDVVVDGMEQRLYVPCVASQMELKFKRHYPLRIVFADYVGRTLDGGCVYELRLVDRSVDKGNPALDGSVDMAVIDNILSNMVPVKGGTFKMGATKGQGKDFSGDERPVHSVTLQDYYIGKYEVTQEEWNAVMGENPSFWRCDDGQLPVDSVSWDDCQSFIGRLNAITGKKFRLPTEAEWEYAARGGGEGSDSKYSGSNRSSDVAWCHSYQNGKGVYDFVMEKQPLCTHSVGMKQPNELGVYDMSGNVWEWCHDVLDSYSSAAQRDPQGPAVGDLRVLRGGSYNDADIASRVSCRFGDKQRSRRRTYGLRLAL